MTDHRPDQFRALPRSLVDLAETLGLRVALALIEHFGGQELRVPKHPGPDHPLLKALGDSDGRALCSFMGGEWVYVPKGAQGGRWRQAAELADRGLSRGEIARILGVSQRHVRRLANGGPRAIDAADQPDLFD